MAIGDDGRIDLTLFGISDMELLAIIDDLADEDGWTRTEEVRIQLGESMDRGYRSGVGPRLSWMKRYGWLENSPDDKKSAGVRKRWRLTAIGNALLEDPKLSSAFQNALAKLNPAQRLVLTREIGETAGGSTDEIRNAIRRQWTRSLGIRR